MTYNSRVPHLPFALVVFLSGIGVGCGRNCATGFSSDDKGVCHADVVCPEGFERRQNLACHRLSEQDETDEVLVDDETGSDLSDTGSDLSDTGTETEWPFDGALLEGGTGRIAVRYTGLDNLTLHAFVVTSRVDEQALPNAAFCQVVLEQSVDILGYLAPYDGESDPCPMDGEPFVFESGRVTLDMLVAGGSETVPVLCDERLVEVDGDIMVDFGDVTSCSQ